MSKSVVVVGAGPCGLVSAKEMLEAGHEVVCLEKSHVIGGVFSTLKESAYDDLFLTVSNVFMAYSDFPCEETYVKYSRKEEYAEYLHKYADAFGLKKVIKFGQTVSRASNAGHGGPKKWRIETTLEDGSTCTYDCDSLVVSTGSNATPKSIEGVAEGFEGTKLHSSEFQNPSAFAGKTCLVIGTGESSADISSELSRVAKRVTCWARRPFLVAPRYFTASLTEAEHDEFTTMTEESQWRKWKAADMLETVTTSRVQNLAPGWFYGLIRMMSWHDNSIKNPAFRMLSVWDRHFYYNLPKNDANKGRAWYQADQVGWATKNSRIACMAANDELDMIVAPTAIFGKDSVTFPAMTLHNGNEHFGGVSRTIDGLDVVFCCTGYKTGFPWLEAEGVCPCPRTWYKHCFPPATGKDLAFTGWARPHQGGIPQCAELLARYHAMLLSGEKELPADIAERTKQEADAETEFYFATPHLTSLVDWPSFSESVADLVGCTPKAPSLLLHPLRFFQFYFLPGWSCWFRQQGPGAKPETLDTVLDRCLPGSGNMGSLPPLPLLIAHFVMAAMTAPLNFVSKILSKPGLHGKWLWNRSKVFLLHGVPFSATSSSG